jgi:hypothetical protein
VPWLDLRSDEDRAASGGAPDAAAALADEALDAAAAALADDPRRLIAVVGEGPPRAAARRLAAAFSHALERDPLAPASDDWQGLCAALSTAPHGSVALLLDGPDDTDALAILPALLRRGLRPGLRVIVPCGRGRAGRLAFRAGQVPRSSIAVVAAPTPASAPPGPELDTPLLPFALVGRAPAGALPGEQELVDRGLVRHHPASGTAVCLLDEDTRAAVARRALSALGDAVAPVRELLEAMPPLRARLLCGVSAAGFVPDDGLADALCAFPAADLPAPLDWLRRGTPLPPWALRALARRVEELGAGHVVRAWAEKLDGAHEAALATVERGLLAARDAHEAAELALLRAAWGGAPEAADEALLRARQAGPDAVRAALAQRSLSLAGRDEPAAALVDELEREALAVADDELTVAAGAALAAARLGEALRRPAEAAIWAERAAAHHLATGDPARAALAQLRAARLWVGGGVGAAASTAAAAASQIGERTGDRRLVGYARWMLGALAERRADPGVAAAEYARSVDAYAEVGAVPERLMPSLARARDAAAGLARQLPGDGGAQIPEADLPPEPGE